MPTRGLEPPRPVGQQILSLPRLPVPPRRHYTQFHRDPQTPRSRWYAPGHTGFVPPILFWLSSISPGISRMAAPSLVGVTHPRRRRCGETQPRCCLDRAHSPCSRAHARLAGRVTPNRWWALTPPFHPLPVPVPGGQAVGGTALCCGCSHQAVTHLVPPLTVSWGALALPPLWAGLGVGRFLYPLRAGSDSPIPYAQGKLAKFHPRLIIERSLSAVKRTETRSP